MANLKFIEYLKTYRLSLMRWVVVGSIISSVFLADYFLKKDISEQVAEAWNEACISQFSVAACIARVDSQHDGCFDGAYRSMLVTFGKSRWDSLKIDAYENCMSEIAILDTTDPTAGKFTITEDHLR